MPSQVEEKSARGLTGLLFEANPKDALPVDRFQILSLDGGGIKGIFVAAVLAAVEADLQISITDHFDLITGTSTGGIIALGLALGMRPRDIVEFYANWGKKIFTPRGYFNRLMKWLQPKYPAAPLQLALQDCFKEKRIADCGKRVVIPSFNLGEDDVYLFRTPHAERLRRDYKQPAWKVAMATSAAPTYFPAMKSIDQMRLIDGGVWANNPTLVGVTEAAGTLQVPLNAIKVLSIGTTQPVVHRGRRLDHGGLLAWANGGAAVDVVMRGQSIAVDNQAAWLLGRKNVVRLNPVCPDSVFQLDGIDSAQDLIGKAQYFSRLHVPLIQHQFLTHSAPQFIPLYT